nr:MAG TPA: hypothetical protein [Caudoviricetes sp.]
MILSLVSTDVLLTLGMMVSDIIDNEIELLNTDIYANDKDDPNYQV